MKTFYVTSVRVVTFKVEAEDEDAALKNHLDDKSVEIGDETLDLQVEESEANGVEETTS